MNGTPLRAVLASLVLVAGLTGLSCSPATPARLDGGAVVDAAPDSVDGAMAKPPDRATDGGSDASGEPGAGSSEAGSSEAGSADAGSELGAPDAGARRTDVFGVTQFHPTATGGREWDSRYWEGDSHAMEFGEVDPADPGGLANRRGDGEVSVNGDGTLRLQGSQPRIYLGSADDHPWLNVEVTVYYRRVEDDDTSYAGLVVGTRGGANGHGIDNCAATTYYARFRHDGSADVEKELEHPASLARATTPLWDGAGTPYGTWIGMKFIVTNVDDGAHVRLRVYRDLTEGAHGGTWEPIIDTTDTGGWSPEHNCPYAEDLIITEGGGVVFLRNTGAEGQGALYKWLTVREIDAGP